MDVGEFDGFGKTAANRPKDEGRDIAFRLDGEVGGFARKFVAAVQVETGFLEKLGGEAQVCGAVHAPEPEFLFIALEEMEGLLELLHGAVEGGSKEEDGQSPGVPGV